MQVRNYGAREIGSRSRFYQTNIDFDFLTTGEAYKDLGDAYVIFFCPFPLWGGARRVYTFENTCREEADLTGRHDEGIPQFRRKADGRY